MKLSTVTEEKLISDLQRVDKINKGEGVTRNFYREHGNYSDKAVASKFATFEDFCHAAGVSQAAATSEEENKSWNIFIPSTKIATSAEIIKAYKVDSRIWELDRFRAKEVTKKGDNSPRFQISAFFKKREDILAMLEEIEALKDMAKRDARKPEKIERPKTLSGNMLEVNIPDVHFGKQAWPVETGHEPYDTKIAYAMFMRALNTLIERTSHFKFDEILFVVGNDIFNSDNIEGTTTKGTQVTTDGRYHKTFYKVRRAMVEAIERLRKIARVKVVIVPGNHDQLAAWHLGDSLECYFHKYDDVKIENTPRTRKYHEFGNNLLMFTHGDKGDRNDYPLLMATEEPVAFGRTKFREIHTGHTHKTKVDEQFGIRVRVLPALCAPDDWHSENGYVGNLRNAEAYVWNKSEGLVGIMIYNDDSQQPIITHRTIDAKK